MGFKLAVLVYKWLHRQHRRTLLTSCIGRPTPRSDFAVSSTSLIVRRTRLSTVGDRAFPVAGPRVWNALPELVTSVASLHVFRNRQLRPISSGVATPKDHHPRSARAVSLVISDTLIVDFYLLTYIVYTFWQIHSLILSDAYVKLQKLIRF